MPNPEIAIVIVAYDAESATQQCLGAIAEHTDIPAHVIAVDNGSKPQTSALLTSMLGRAPIRFPANVGIPKAKNAGLAKAIEGGFKYVCFIDNDCIVSAGWLSKMVKVLDENPKLAAIGPMTLNCDYAGQILPSAFLSFGLPRIVSQIANLPTNHQAVSLSGFCMVARTEALVKVGPFDEDFGIYGFENEDLCRRLTKEGYGLAIADNIYVLHRGGMSKRVHPEVLWHEVKAIAQGKYETKIKDIAGVGIPPVRTAAAAAAAAATTTTRAAIEEGLPFTSIVVLTHNRLDMTRQCIESILSNTKEDIELIVVDNGSTDGTVSYLESKPLKLIRNDKNLGVPKARNQGILAANGQLIVLIDNDCEVRPGWLKELVQVMDKEGASLCGIEGWKLGPNHAPIKQCTRKGESFDYIGGACTVFKREIFEKVGLLDEAFSPAYFEDSLSGDRLVPIRIGDRIDVISLSALFEMGKKFTREDGKEESILDGVQTLSVNESLPCPITEDLPSLPKWWTDRFLSDQEKDIYNLYKHGKTWSQAETSVTGKPYKACVGPRIKKRLKRSRQEDALGEWKPLTKVIRHKTSKQLVRIDSKFGQTRCTTDHSLMKWKGEALKECNPSEIGEDNLCSVTMPIECPVDKKIYLLLLGVSPSNTKPFVSWRNDKGERYSFPTVIDYSNEALSRAFFKVLGEFASEGSVCGNCVKICGTSKKAMFAVSACLSLITRRNIKVHRYINSEKKGLLRGKKVASNHKFMYSVIINNKAIADFFVKNCGKGARNKKIPSFVFTAPVYLKQEFLKHLFRGDAYTFNRKRSVFEKKFTNWYKQSAFRFCSISLALASGTCFLLASLEKRFSVGYDPMKQAYSVDYVAYRRNSKVCIPRLTYEPSGDNYVYDLTVSDYHTFVDAMGLLVVHNTDICVRSVAAKYKMAWCATPKIVHKQHATLIYGQKQFNYQTALSTSHQYFAKKMNGLIKPEYKYLPQIDTAAVTTTVPATAKKDKLRILYLGMQDDYGDPKRGESFEHNNFYPGLKQYDRTEAFYHFDFVSIGQRFGIQKMSEMLLQVTKEFNPDMLFSVFFNPGCDPQKAVVRQISNSIPTIGWFCDSHFRYSSFDRSWAPSLRYCVTTAVSAIQKYKADGFASKVIKSQWFASPSYQKIDGTKKDIDVSFVGQPHGDRRQIISALLGAGIKVETYGYGWAKRIDFDGMIKVFNRSKINLNLNNAADIKYKQIKGRNFEVPACGGFLLTESAENLHTYYTPNKEVGIFASTNDLISKVRYYLAHEDEREAIALAGYERTLKEHTAQSRMHEIFKTIGIVRAN